MKLKCFLLLTGLFLASSASAQWVKQEVGTDASFRGLSVVNPKVVWASGTKGTYIRTTDGGAHWQVGQVPGAEALDFRDVEAFDANTAYLMAAGPGEASRIYKTIDGGKNWTLQYQNKEPNAFFDAMAFWDARHGMVLSDPIDGRFLLLRTDDGGKSWIPLPIEQRPKANDGEAAFAASGTCLITAGVKDLWVATGGTTARVLHSSNRGRTWSEAKTGLAEGKSSMGNFSIAFSGRYGVVVGGDYQEPGETAQTVAFTSDGGHSWSTRVENGPKGFRSAVAVKMIAIVRMWIAVGTNGSDISTNDGKTWYFFSEDDLNSVAFGDEITYYAVGAKGRVLKYTGQRSGRYQKRGRR